VLIGPVSRCVAGSTNEDMTPRALAAAVAAQLPDFDLVSAHQDRGGDADEEDVWAGYDQDAEVTGDPRDLDLPLPAEDPLAAVSDPSVGLVAGPEQLQAGDALTVWQD
jgi:hypothetical protein